MKRSEYQQTAADAILGVYEALMDGQSPGEVLAELGDLMEPASDNFALGAASMSREQMVDAFNEVVGVASHVQTALTEMGVFLLASVVNNTDVSAEEVMRRAVARAQE